MTADVEINGVTLVPIKDAAVAVSYSRDYVSRLAREGKIVASQIGRQWFVDLDSLMTFSKSAELQDEARKHELRVERKSELKTKEALDVLSSLTVQKVRDHHLDAVGVSFATLCLGFVVGISLYAASQFSTSPVFALVSEWTSLSNSLVPETTNYPASVSESFATIPEPKETLLLTSVAEKSVFITESETRRLEASDAGILVFSPGELDSRVDVQALFSDDVTVTFAQDNSGVIKYEQTSGEVVEYPFVSVPENTGVRKESEVIKTAQ